MCTGSSDVEMMSVLACTRSSHVCTGSSDRRSCQFVCVQGHHVCAYRVTRQVKTIMSVCVYKVIIVCVCVYRVIRQVKMIMLVCVYRVIRRRSYQVVCIQGHHVYRVIRQEKVMLICVCTGSSDMWR